jgi:hypothetical protein
MAGNLDLNETSTRLVQKALDSGEWQSVRDHTGREVYFNEVTRETTRDLRVLLLQRFEWAKPGSAALQSKDKALRTTADGIAATTTSNDSAGELAATQKALLAYEREVTELRMRLFGVKQTAAAATADERALAAASSAQGLSDDVEVLQRQLTASRRLNALLLERVTNDRLAQRLCAVCLERTAVPAAAVDTASLLASETLAFPNSLAPFTRTADRVMIRALATGADYSPTSPPPSLGYLPSTLQPAEPSYSSLRPKAQPVTSHAPLKTQAGVLSASPRRFDVSQREDSYTSPPSTRRRDEAQKQLRVPSTAAAMSPASHHADITLTGMPPRKVAAGIPTKLYDGGIHQVFRREDW